MIMKKLSIFAVAAFACLCFIGVMSGEVFADGTEALGVPSIPIESGSGVVAAGVGLANAQPETIKITVPGSTVKQVLLYWEGSMGDKTDNPDDYSTITVNTNSITGDLIGGPYHPFTGDHWNGLAFRADITDLDLVVPGSNTLSVGNANFSGVANGAGLLVIYEDASSPRTEISIRDGEDFAYHGFDGLLTTTVPQTFTFSEVSVDRTATLNMFFTTVKGVFSGGEFRPTAIRIESKKQTGEIMGTDWINNELSSNDGEEWDTVNLDVKIPAGANSLTIQAYSLNNTSGYQDNNPASLTWTAAALSMPLELCSIGDFVWYDDNNDGIQDALESGIDDVLVRLYNCSNLLVGTTSTTNGGKYKFTDLVPGDYSLEFIAPYGYAFSPQNQGSDDVVDSDADPVTGKTVCTTLEGGEYDSTWDAGLVECGPCKGKITELTLKYTGDPTDFIEVFQKKDPVPIFDGYAVPDGEFTFVGTDKNGTMGTEITIKVDGSEYKIHTSCSQPIGPGLISGDFVVIEGYSLEGGLLCPTDEDDDCECDGKVTWLTLQYNGTIDDATIKVVQKKDSVEIFEDIVQPGELFTFVGEDKNGTMGTEIKIYVDGDENTKIHTSCSQPIGPGLISGDFKVIEGYSLKGGLLCPTDEDDDCECDGKVTELTLQNNGTGATIKVVQKKDNIEIFNQFVNAGGEFTFVGQDKNGTMGTEIIIYVGVVENTKIHTSCSKPIGPGLKSGDFEVIEGESLKGGPLCPMP
jgi:SdrD B-like protein